MIKPIGFTAVVVPLELKEVYKGTIVLAVDETMERNAQVIGTLISMGPDFAAAYKPSIPFWGLKPGDKVIYAKYAGKWVKDPEDGKEYLIILDQDVVGKYEHSDPVVASEKA